MGKQGGMGGRLLGRAAGGLLASVLLVGLIPGVWGGVAQAAPAAAGDASPAGASGTVSEDKALAEARRTGKNVEVLSLRGGSREVFATPSGNFEAREHLRPVRARVDGKWMPVDTTLVRTDDGEVVPKAVTVGLAFSGGGEEPFVRLDRAGRELALSWPGSLPAPQLEGDTATYPEVLAGVDLRVTAQVDGFTQVLVVKSAQAAQSEQLEGLRLGVRAEGMSVRETAAGGLEAVDAGAGGAVFEAATPMMWDSSPGAGAGEPTVSPEQTEGYQPEEPGAGESGKLAQVGVEVASGGVELVLTPDREVLTGSDTVYPVFIDPQWYAPKASAWTMASKYWASSPQWKFNGESDAGLGYCGWMYCRPYDTKRLFYQFPVSTFAGKSILSAEFVVRETHAASCQAREVQVWRTKGITSSTTWNSQNASGFWIDHLDTRSFAHGYDGCAAADAEFNVKDAVEDAAAYKWSALTIGMRATSETDPYTWKRFADDAYLRVHYNRPPAQIAMSQLTQDPGGVCAKPVAPKRVRILPTVRANNVTDPDGDSVSVQFQASWDTGDGKGFTGRWTAARSSYKASGSDFSIKLPTSVPQNKTVGWHARTYDGAQWSPWSFTGSPTSCNMVYDTSVPAGPVISSGQYPVSDPENPNDPWTDGVGRYGTFTLDSSATDVTKYWFGINADPSSKNMLTTTDGAAKSTKFMPTRPGVNFVTAQAFDAAGNGSDIRTYQFRVRAGQPDRVTLGLDEQAGSATVSGAGGAWPATLAGGAAPSTQGAIGSAVHFDGVDDTAATVSPVLNTGKSFSVSLWAKLPVDKPNQAAVAVSQAGLNTSGFEIYHSSALGGWVFLRHTMDAAGTTTVRAAQPACPTGDTACEQARLGTWTHLTGVFDNAAQELRLYVDGALVGTAPFTGPWDARGQTRLGATSVYGSLNNFFPGELDQVELFDYQLTAGQVATLHAKEPVETNRPAKVVWPLDEGASATEVTGRGQQVSATLHGGATLGGEGVDGTALSLDGTDDTARTGQPVLDTYQSFAVSLWARLPEDKEQRAMVAVTQDASRKQGFEISHSSALGGWVFLRAKDNTDEAGVVRATQDACPPDTHCAAARLGQWTHVVGVYDHDVQQMRLYVDGVLVGTQPFTTPWLATGPLTLGAADYVDDTGGYLKGDLDQVRLFDRAVSDDEVQQLFKQHPVLTGRWMFEEAAGAPALSPDATGAGRDMTLNGDARIGMGWVDFGALELDGVDDYAATPSVPLETDVSYTVTAWAQASAQPGNSAAVLSTDGGEQSTFAVRYVPGAAGSGDIGRWRITVPDEGTATTATVDNQNFSDIAAWNHLALVYDGFARQVRLYVNGQLEQVVCADTDGDGTPNDPACTEHVSWAENVVSFEATGALQVGRAKTGGSWGEYWPGAIDDVWTFQGALTDEQVAILAGSFFDLPTKVPGGA